MICAKCKEVIPKYDLHNFSRFPNSNHILCDICFDNEEAEFCLGGDEALAELLASYGEPN